MYHCNFRYLVGEHVPDKVLKEEGSPAISATVQQDSRCTGPEVGIGLPCWRKSKKVVCLEMRSMVIGGVRAARMYVLQVMWAWQTAVRTLEFSQSRKPREGFEGSDI